MKTILNIIAQFTGVVLLAEFAAGLVHWFEDAYIRETTPVVGKLIGRPNVVHHHYPRFMTRHTWWQSSWDLVLLAVVMVAAAWFLHVLTWHVWLFAIIAANANEFHKWEHRTRKENGRIITFLQDIRILQSSQHHAKHHTDPKNSHYCTITNLMNPVLDTLRLWDCLEWLLANTIGARSWTTSRLGERICPVREVWF